MLKKYLLNRDIIDNRDYKFSLTPPVSIKLPKMFDLRNMCPVVYNQGQEGSCTANAGCAARAILLRNPSLYLSRAFLYYEERNLRGTTDQDSGASIRDICKAAKKYGICEDLYMPYIDGDYTTPPSDEAIKNALKYTITAYKRLISIDDIKKSLVFNQNPVLIGMTVFESMESDAVAKTGKLPMPIQNEQQLGGHAVLVVGYNDTKSFQSMIFNMINFGICSSGYLIVRNSWGEAWGDKGYFYMPYEYFLKYTYDYWIFE